MQRLLSKMVVNTTSLTTALCWIDLAIQHNATIFLMFHQLATPASTEYDWTHANFQLLMEYIVARKIKCITIDEWYKGLTNPRWRSVPLSRVPV